MTQYIALAHSNGEGGYGISFPDFPGCITVADSLDDALRAGTEVLAFHVHHMLADGDDIPDPSSPSALQAAGEDVADFSDAIVLAIPLLPAPGKFVKANMTLDQNLLARVDAVTKNRSSFVATALERMLQDPIVSPNIAKTRAIKSQGPTKAEAIVHAMKQGKAPRRLASEQVGAGDYEVRAVITPGGSSTPSVERVRNTSKPNASGKPDKWRKA